MARTISFLYESELLSAEFNQRFADILAGSVLSGYRFELSSTPRYINLVRGGDVSSVLVTNLGTRIEEEADVNDNLYLEANTTSTDRIDSIYLTYIHGSTNDSVEYVVIKGYPDGTPVPMMNKEMYTFLGYIKVPAEDQPLTEIDLMPVEIGIRKLDVAGKANLKGDVLVEGSTQIERSLLVKGGITIESDALFKGKITSERQPVDDLDVATKSYVDAVKTGLAPKDSVRVLANYPITLYGAQIIDGIQLEIGDRILVKAQTDSSENGIYIVGEEQWRRSPDADNSNLGGYSEVRSGMYCLVREGDAYAITGWLLATSGDIELGVTPLTFVQFSGVNDQLATEDKRGLMSSLDKRRVNGYIHNQVSTSATWEIYHNLEKYPSVTVVDSGGNTVIGDVNYPNTNFITISFTSAFSGKAYLN